MWLTKEQIKNDFYISIEYDIIPCLYKLEILIYNNSLLNLGEQYTYFISQDNKYFSFNILGKVNIINKNFNNNTIVVWAKGNKEIKADLNSECEYIKHPKYNIFLIKIEKEKLLKDNYFLFNFKVEGIEDDLINIGSLFFDGSDMSKSSQILSSDQEITGFLKNNLKNKNCYEIPKNLNNIILFQTAVYENKEITINKEDSLYCITMPDEYDNVMYSIYFFQDNKDIYSKNLIRTSPLLNNIEYNKEINKNITFGLVPMKQNEDMDYITYYINPIKGKYKIGVYFCETYPLCTINSDIDKNTNYEEIKYLNSFSMSISDSEDNNILNKISRSQYIIIIKSDVDSNGDNNDKNHFYVNLYNQRYTTILKPNILYSKYIRKKNHDNYLINHKNDEIINSIYLFIEGISGDFEINDLEVKNHTRYKVENKRLFIIHQNYNESYTKISFKISAKTTNTFFKISYLKNLLDKK